MIAGAVVLLPCVLPSLAWARLVSLSPSAKGSLPTSTVKRMSIVRPVLPGSSTVPKASSKALPPGVESVGVVPAKAKKSSAGP